MRSIASSTDRQACLPLIYLPKVEVLLQHKADATVVSLQASTCPTYKKRRNEEVTWLIASRAQGETALLRARTFRGWWGWGSLDYTAGIPAVPRFIA